MVKQSTESKESEILFGRLAVKGGYCTENQVNEALELLRQVHALGREISLGEVLLKKGVLSDDQVDDILTRQGRENENLIEGYRILKKLGEGGMGKVYQAIQISMDRPVALKVLNKRYNDDDVFVRRFFREARAAGRLNHPHVVQGYDSGTSHGRHYFAMEYVEGETAAARLERDGPWSEEAALKVALGVAKALVHAAQQGLVHRDIKPDNILIAKDGIVKLTDLGLARESVDGGITRVGMAMGTPHYISPEQARAEAVIDVRSDIYSLGASLFHMLSGEVPFTGRNIEVILTKHVVEAPRRVGGLRPDLSEAVDLLVMKMMAKDPGDRFQSPEELVAAMGSILTTPTQGDLPPEQKIERERLESLARPPQAGPVSEAASADLPGGDKLKRSSFKALQKDHGPHFIVFYEGQESDRVYLLLQGRVELLRAGRLQRVVETGFYFGEMSVLKGTHRETTARTLEPSRLVELTREQYLQILQASPKLSLGLIERLVDCLKESDSRLDLNDQKLDAARSQLKTHISRQGEMASLLRELAQDWSNAQGDAALLKVFHEDFGRRLRDTSVTEWVNPKK